MLRGNNSKKVSHTNNNNNNNNQFQEKSNYSENGTSSKILFPTYTKRPGTNDAGKEFVYMMCALYALKLSTDKDTVEFKMTTNNEKYRDFDDISLEIETGHETKTFLLQLLHKENEEQFVTNQKLISPKSELSLTKYLKSFNKLNVENVICLVYTNSPANLENGSNFVISSTTQKNSEEQTEEGKLNVSVKKPLALEFLRLLQNKKNPNNVDDIFQFDITQEKPKSPKLEKFCTNFFLMTGQDNVETVKATVRNNLNFLLKVDIYDSFIFFMKEWWSGRFILTKHNVILKLVELAMSPWIQTVSSKKVNSKTKLLSTGIMNFEMTILKNTNNNIINNMWEDTAEESESKKIVQMYRIKENQTKESKILWLLDKIPLIVKVDSQNKQEVKHSIKLLECLSQKKKLILLGDARQDEFPEWNVLENLKDLYSLKNIYVEVMRLFRISIQGRASINLDSLIRKSQDFVDVIEIDDLLNMAQEEYLEIGNTNNSLSLTEFYIQRKVSAACINTTDLLDSLERVDKHVFIINGPVEFNNIPNTERLLVMEINAFLEKENTDKFRNLILLSNDEPCTYNKFESVRKKLDSFQVYLFQIVDKNYCIHLMNVGNKKFLKNCSNMLIEETEILHCFKNQLNFVCGPSGMGKSVLFNVLSESCSTNFWVLHIKLIDHNSILATQPHEQQLLEHLLEANKGSELYSKILKVYLRNKKILILLDDLDAVKSQNVKCLLNCCELLAVQGFHVWIASRENWQKKYSQYLELFTTVDIVELDENEQKLYIEKRLKNEYNSSDINEIVNAVFKSSDIANGRQLLGIPLLLHIITENFVANKNLFSALKEENIFVLTTMYKFFFEGKKKFHLKKMAIDKRPDLIGFSFRHHLKQYELPALRVCLDDDAFEKLNLDECNCQEFLEDIKARGDKFGIIKYIMPDNRVVFSHETYAEYFACVWFVQNLSKVKLLKEKWFSEKYETLRLIFDIMLSEQSPLHLAVIYNNIEQFRKYVDNDDKDKAGRNALYSACCYGMKYPIPTFTDRFLDYRNCHVKRESEVYVEIVDSLLERYHDMFEEDLLFGINYINYALSCRCLYVIEACLERKLLSFREIEKLLKKYYRFETLAFYASQMNYVYLLQNILETVDCNITFIHESKELLNHLNFGPQSSLLFVAIVGSRDQQQVISKEENVAAVKEILKFMDKKIVRDQEKQKHSKGYQQLESGELVTLARELGRYKIMEILSTYQTTRHDYKPLYLSVILGTLNDEVLELSRTIGLDLNEKNPSGETAVYKACQNGNERFVKQLLDFGAEIDIPNGFQEDHVLHVTAKLEKENIAIMQMLLNKMNSEGKSLVNTPDNNGHYPLFFACENCHISYVRLLRENGAKIDVSDTFGNTVLHYAAKAGKENEEIINILLNSGMNINGRNGQGQTALHMACEKGIFSNVKLLIYRGSDINIRSDDGSTCLHYAAKCSNENTETIQFLIHNNLEVNIQNNEGYTPLNFACCEEFFDKHDKNKRVLLENGADPSIVNENGESPLHCLLMYRQFYTSCKIISVLLSNNRLDINSVDRNRNTALHVALEREARCEIIEELLKHGADPNIPDTNGRNALHKLCIYDSYSTDSSKNINMLLSYDVNINAQDDHGRTPLHLLCMAEYCSRKNLLQLLEAGAEVNIFDDQKMTVLHYEANKLSEEVNDLDLLTKYRADLNLQNNEGQTPLHLAVKQEKWNKVQTLLDSDADINVMDNGGRTALHYLSCYGKEQIRKLLADKSSNAEEKTPLHLAFEKKTYNKVKAFIEFGADVNVVDDKKENILHYAMKLSSMSKEEKNISKLLINNGINLNAQNVHGESPLHLAFQNRSLSFVKFLLENGANESLLTLEKKNMLHYAAESRYHNHITKLLQKGFDKNAQDVNGTSILHCACRSGRLGNIKILISRGANIHVTDNEQQTILHYAALSPNPEQDFIEYLVKTGVDIYAHDSNGRNALDVAFEYKCFKALQLLIQTEKYFYSTKVAWSTVLNYSVFGGCLGGIKYLMLHNENIDNLVRNADCFFEFLKDSGEFQKRFLLKMTVYVAFLIQNFGASDSTLAYDPLKMKEYIKYKISEGYINDSIFENVDGYRYFIENNLPREKNIRTK